VYLVEEGLAGAGGHDDEGIAAREHAVDHLPLVGPELLVIEHCRRAGV
jgi:hypothetical protein